MPDSSIQQDKELTLRDRLRHLTDGSLEEYHYDELVAFIQARDKELARKARINELKRAKMQGYITKPLLHKVDRRLRELSS